MIRKNLGITLISLIVTVIILLILAGITINTLVNNGLFNRVKESKDRWRNAQEDEETQIAKYNNEINNYVEGNRNNVNVEDYTDNLIFKLNLENLNSQTGVSINGSGIIVSNDKKYITFEGNSYIQISNNVIDPNETFRTLSDTTLCCWYRTTNNNQSDETRFLTYGGDHQWQVRDNHYLQLKSNATIIGAGQGYGTCNKSADPSNIKDGNWHFVVGVWKNYNTVELYYDLVPFSSTGSYSTSDSYLTLGSGGNDDASASYIGDMADVRVYSVALTPTQIKQLYNYGRQFYE